MSSTAEAVKHPSEGDAPSPKKIKTDEKDATKSDNNNADNNNGIAANVDSTEREAQSSSCGGDDARASNGNNREPDGDNEDEQGGDELAGEGLDSDLEPFDPKVTRRLQSVENIQQQISKLNELASEEILKVEQRFNKLRRPYFEKRNALLKDVPNFWVTCLANHSSIADLIESPEDEDCLHYMVNLDVEELEDIKSGYNLKFHFKENPYINNDLIIREIRHLNSDEVLSKSTPIEYKDTPQGRSLKNFVEACVGQSSRSGERVEQSSFFAWLSSPCETGSDEIAEIIKDQVWPSPLEYFFQAPADDYDGNSDDEDEEDDDSDEEDYGEEFDNEVEGGIPEDDVPEEDIEGEELEDEIDDEGDQDDDEEDEE